METRILIPNQLKIVLKTSSSSLSESKVSHNPLRDGKSIGRGKNLSKTKKRKLNYSGGKQNLSSNSDHSIQRGDVKQKPTSSSGCDAESDTDLDLVDDEDEDSNSVTEEEDDEFRQSGSCGSDEDEGKIKKENNEDDCNEEEEEWSKKGDGEKRRKKFGWINNNYNLRKCTTGSETGQLKNCEGQNQNGPLVTIANADSINQIESSTGCGDEERGGEIKICAARRIEKGTIFTPNEGQVSIVYLKNIQPIRADDIRFVFGCFDRTVDDDEVKEEAETESENSDMEEETNDKDDGERKSKRKKNQIRLCNWVRFVRQVHSHTDPKVNVRAKFVERKAILEFTQSVSTGTELYVYFDIDSLTQNVQNKGSPNPNQTAPLDLSKSLDVKPRLRSTKSISLDQSESKGEEESHLVDQSDNDPSRSPTSPPPRPQYFPFSINSVLQPVKLFQPYNHRSNNESSNNRDVGSRPIIQYPTMSIQQQQHNQQTAVAAIQSTLNGGRSSGLHMMTHLNLRGGGNGPGGGGNPVGTLKPILRTRGRERSLLPCEVCGKAFDRPSLLKRHMRTHTGEKPHICDVCSKGFSTSSSLNTHRRIHSGEKPHQCPVCGKRFTASSNLYYHRMTHNKEKPHKCLCGKSFPTPGDLKSHQYVHSGSWPYNCPVCHRGFSKQTNLRNHLLLHSGDKPHNCQACGKKFALACNLRAHLRTHEEEPVSSCISCKRTFLSSLNMLDNGQCRSCIIHHQQQQNSPSISVNSSSSGSSGHSLNRNIFSLPPSSAQSPGSTPGNVSNNKNPDLKSPENLSISLSKISRGGGGEGNPTNVNSGFPNSAAAAAAAALSMSLSESSESLLTSHPGGFHFPNSAASLSHLGLPSVPYHHLSESLLGPRPNPFLEQLFQWNWRFAKETAGNLGLMQQKLIESQMLAAQLMSVSSNGSIGSSDILKFRL